VKADIALEIKEFPKETIEEARRREKKKGMKNFRHMNLPLI
jgi:hypothetical protein